MDGGEPAAGAVQSGELIGNDDLDPARARQFVEARDRLRHGAEFRPAMHDKDALGDLGERQGPVDGGVAAAGDDDMPAAKILAPPHQIKDAAALELLDPGQRRTVRAERADPGGDDDGAGGDANAGSAFDPEPLRRLIEPDDRTAEMIDRRERRRLLDETIDEIAGGDSRIARDVV